MGKLGVVIYTRDGGKTWERQASDDTLGLNLNGVSFVNAQTGWVMTERGSVMLKTEDGGKTRARQFISNTGLRFVSSNDGGITWTRWPSGTEAGLRGVAFADANNGWAVGEDGTILKFGPR